MAKYALASDLHFHNWTLFAGVDRDGVNTRLDRVLQEFERFCEHAASVGCNRLYIAGDVFHVRGQVTPSVLNPVTIQMNRAARHYNLDVRIMCGNHDLESKETQWLHSAIWSLQKDSFISVVHEPTFWDDDNVLMVPWVSNKAKLTAVIEDQAKHLDEIGCDLQEIDLILHTGINGVIIGLPDHGFGAEELAAFGFKRVFSGHYHNHKVFEIIKPGGLGETAQVVSIGALTHQTWSDVGSKAGWLIVDQSSFEFHENQQPKFMDFDLDADLEDYAGNYVRVRGIELEEDEIKTLRSGLMDAGALEVSVHAVPKSKIVTRSGASPKTTATIEGSVTDWIKEAAIEDASAVEKEAIDVLNEVRSE